MHRSNSTIALSVLVAAWALVVVIGLYSIAPSADVGPAASPARPHAVPSARDWQLELPTLPQATLAARPGELLSE